jgi:glycosyltransferase involved in cell wall biosynthesis
MISVITPIYNGERFIEACIKAVIDQNCSHVEHIIVDGGSTDQTIEIIKQYTDRYSHIRWVSEKDNGQSDAINKGIQLSKGSIIALLNVDDCYEPDTLNKVLQRFEYYPEPTLLVGNCNCWNSQRELYKINKPYKLDIQSLVMGYNVYPHPVNPSAYFYHASLHEQIGLYSEQDHYTMDLDFICKAVQMANVVYIDEVWGNFYLHEASKTAISMMKGQDHQRGNAVLNKYRQSFSMPQRLFLTLEYHLYQKMPRARYLIREPQKLRKTVVQKIREFRWGNRPMIG